jgi:integrase
METLTASQRSCIKKLREDCGVDDLSVDPVKTFAAMDKRYSVSSTRQAITALRKMYPENKVFIAEMKKRGPVYKGIDKSQTPTEKQAAAHIDWDDIIAWRDGAGKELPILDRLLVGLYTYVPPQRVDYTPMRIVARLPKKLDEGINYLVMAKKSARFVFHAYKTADKYGDRAIHASAELFKLIAEYLGERRAGYLFQDAGIAWTEARLGVNIRRIFQKSHNKDFGVNGLRHSYATKINEGMPSLASLEEAAMAMGHNVITHQTYRHIPLETA